MPLTELEKIFNSAKQSASPVEMMRAIIPLVNAYQQARKYDTAIRCLKEMLPIIRDKGEMDQEAVILTALGTAYWEKAQLQKALNHFEEALKMFKEVHDKQGIAIILSIVGITFWRKCDWDKALEILKDALKQNGEKKVEQRFASLYGALDRGIATLQNRVRMGRELQDPVKILQPLFSMCLLYWVIGNHGQFKVCLDEAVALAQSLNKTDILQAAEGIRQLGHPV
tara:strand:+ start:73 stop:750 length:678 start_codon:yes stop_codon:yes gene_type:complete